MGTARVLSRYHVFHSNDDRNEVWTSSSDWNEFVLKLVALFRVYAVTGKDRWLCSPLFLLIILQVTADMITTGFYLRLPSGSFDARSFTPVDLHPGQLLPEAISDMFRLCGGTQWKPGSLSYIIISLTFGAFSSSIFYLWSSNIYHVLCYRHLCLLDTRNQSQERNVV